ncbi:MAG: TIR domain-containing protein [Planctomycetota bacterium]
MQPLRTLHVDGRLGPADLVLSHGNLVEAGAAHPVDVLVVSTFPGDYAPTSKSVVGALNVRGLSLSDLARDKAIDLRHEFGSWLSHDIGALGSGVHAQRVLCVEDPSPSKLFRSLVAVLSDAQQPASVAMPLIGAGDQGLPVEQVVPSILEAAVRWIELGLPLRRLEIVVRDKTAAEVASAAFDRFLADRRERVLSELLARTEARADFDFEHSPAPAEEPARYDVFVSYSHHDASAAETVAEALRARNRRVFLDRSELEPGVIWQQRIFESLDACDTIVPLLSPRYLESAFCIEEFHIALIRRRHERTELLTPIYLASAKLPTYMQLVQWIDCRESDTAKLRGAVDRLGQQRGERSRDDA